MVDMSDLSAHHGSDASKARLKKRRAAETRLRFYGILAIVLAGAALVTLLWSVVGNARYALSESYVTVPVTLDAEALGVDPEDPDTIRRGDFERLVRDAVREKFDYVSGRTLRRELSDLYSAGAVFDLRDEVVADPSMIGDQVSARLLASDVTDLYLKGEYGTLEQLDVDATLDFEFVDDEIVQIEASAPIFTAALQSVQADLVTLSERREREAARQDAGVVEFQRRADASETEDERDTNLAQVVARAAARDALLAEAEDLRARGADPEAREAMTDANESLLIAVNGGWLKVVEVSASAATAEIYAPLESTDAPFEYTLYTNELAEEARRVSDHQIVWIEELRAEGNVEQVFNTRFFTAGDSRDPERAGIWGAAVGSFWTMIVTFALAFPIGTLAAIYLEEFAPKNRFTDFVEVNINNLAAVPSIVFGLLGLAVFLGFFGVPRSAPVAGGIVLALMTLPTIIIASRAAIRAVPPSIRDAALGLGASKLQTSFHHVLPLAMPGILTGTIIGMAQALGETAPLILIGMVAFIVEIPQGVTDPATVLPVQVFRWSDFPERAFEARTAAAICVLLLFLVLMNALAVFLRKRFERRW
ncbi:phosphate ABC transporter permease PstA [Pontivivens insulae]|uniref:Phosphate transport system permease protein PstA n=1 Tax=Pontivivens insulae TaxID=1639689 RepID=A0A2R8A738_9RHOB|nr:phosphate ABC transporter permease PstA [Pontivivens insulae]RED18166.1 phosphate transport system permease protein [Pontivivens insulae]SPF28063.1 Phosphate transport system permease protein PstA [Pontivivens insulae]